MRVSKTSGIYFKQEVQYRMSDDVKFIFQTLIKVPVIIFEIYLVFNVFCFMFIYFKTLGISYVVMQTVVENNYIPQEDMNNLNGYINQLLGITFVETQDKNGNKTEIIVGDNTRTQYGATKECGVRVCYKFQWPLRPDQQTDNGVAVNGLGDGGGEYKNFGMLDIIIPIKITYTVPGLQYYPDLNIA